MSDTITVTGNIATEPEFKHTPTGVPITSFRVASSQRRFDRTTGTWIDGLTNYYTVSTFRSLAEHAHTSFKKGDRVLLTGRVRMREWDNGTKRGTSVEIDAEAIGHDLLWGTTTFRRTSPSGRGNAGADESEWRTTDAPAPVVPDGVPDAWSAPGVQPSGPRSQEALSASAAPPVADVPF